MNKPMNMTEIIHNRYQILQRLDEGHPREVYRVRDRLYPNRPLLLKTLRKDMLDSQALESFKRNFDALSRLKHPNLARVYDFNRDEERRFYYVTRDNVSGVSLHDLVKGDIPLPPEILVDLLVDFCRTMTFMHSRGVRHGNIKLTNIFTSAALLEPQTLKRDDLQLKVLDFGLTNPENLPAHHTKDTLPRVAPEALKGEMDIRADIFAAGIAFYELLTRESFYTAEQTRNILELLKNAGRFQQAHDQALNKVADPVWQAILGRMTAYLPNDRYNAFYEILADVNARLNLAYPPEKPATLEAYTLGISFVAREAELRQLEESISDPARLTLIQGKAALGKSRLLREFKKLCLAKSRLYLAGQCPAQILQTYAPITRIISNLLYETTDTVIRRYGPELKKLLPAHDRLQIVAASPLCDPQTERGLMVETMATFLLEAAAQHTRNIVIVLEDLQDADDGTLACLSELMLKIARLSLTQAVPKIIASLANDPDRAEPALLRQFIRQERAVVINLNPFSTGEALGCIEAAFGSNGLSPMLREAVPILNETVGGNPLLFLETLRALIYQGIIIRTGLSWNITKSAQEIRLPHDADELLRSRLAALAFNPDEKLALQLYALLSRPVDLETFRKIAQGQLSVAFLEGGLIGFFHELERLEILDTLILPDENEAFFRFHDRLLRRVILSDIENPAVLQHHIARKLEDIYRSRSNDFVEELSHHFALTDNAGKARNYLIKAGEKAKARFSNEVALAYYDRALHFTSMDDYKRRAAVQCCKGELLEMSGKEDEAETLYSQAIEQARLSGDLAQIAHVKWRLGLLQHKLNREEDAQKSIEEALTIYQQLNNAKGLSQCYGGLGHIQQRQACYDDALQSFRLQYAAAEKVNDPNILGDTCGNLSTILLTRGEADAALEYAHKRQELARQTGDRRRRAEAAAQLGGLRRYLQDDTQAIVYYQEMLDLARELGDKRLTGQALDNMALVHEHLGHYDEARAFYQQNLTLQQEAGNRRQVGEIKGNIGKLYETQGDFESARVHYEDARVITHETGDKIGVVRLELYIATLDALQQRHEEAISHANIAIQAAEEKDAALYKAAALFEKARSLYELDRHSEADQLLSQAQPLAEMLKADDLVFACQLLAARLLFSQTAAKAGQSAALEQLQRLIGSHETDANRAQIYLTLFELNPKFEYGKRALELFQALQQTRPRYSYQQAVARIEKRLRNLSEAPLDSGGELSPGERAEANLDRVRSSLELLKSELRQFENTGVSAEYKKLLHISKQLTSSLTFDDVAAKTVSFGLDLLQADNAMLMLFDEDGTLQNSRALNKSGLELRPAEVIRLMKAVQNAPQSFPVQIEIAGENEGGRSFGIIFSLAPPPTDSRHDSALLAFRNKTLGLVIFESHAACHASRLELVQEFIDQAVIALINAQLYQLTNIDPLTGLYLRPFFDASLEKALQRCQRTHMPLTMLLVNVDTLKRVNEDYGRQAGDEVLKAFAKVFMQAFRTADTCARYSGGRFAVALSLTPTLRAVDTAKRVIDLVNQHQFPYGDLNISIGITNYPEHWDLGKPLAKNPFVAQAEQALNTAQKIGENNFVVWDKSMAEMKHLRNMVANILTGNPIKDYRNVEMLLTAIKDVSSTLDLAELLVKIMDMMLRLSDAERGLLFIYQSDQDLLKIRVARTRSGEDLGESPTYSHSIVNNVFESGRPICLKDVADEIATVSMMNLELRSVMCIPIEVKNKRFGVIYVDGHSSLHEFSDADLAFFHALSSQIAGAIENARLHEESLEIERITNELNVASQIQLSLVPSKPPDIPGLQLLGRMETAKAVGGDYYDYVPSEDGRKHYIVIGDVAGKGVPASLVMVQVRSIFHTLALQNLSTTDILVNMNELLYRDLLNFKNPMFVTMVLMCWDSETRIMTYTGAGHEHILIYRQASKTCEAIRSGGLWLGMEEDVEPFLKEKTLPLEPGDTVMLYTDGVTEFNDPDKNMYGFDRLKAFFGKNGALPPDQMLVRLYLELGIFANGAAQWDDTTVMVIKTITDS